MMMNRVLKRLNIFILYRFGSAIGDQLCMSAIVENLCDQHKLNVIVFSNYSELFENNPKVYKNYSFKKIPKLLRNTLLTVLRRCEGEHIASFCFPADKEHTLEHYMRSSRATISLIEAHALHFRKKLTVKNAIPKLYFSDNELQRFAVKFKDLPAHYSIVQPIGKTTYTPNKEWGFKKFQNVIKSTREVNWVQTGLSNDLLLDNAIDCRGRTESLRELAYIISKADYILCLEGLFNHLAASVGTTSFCIFSGFHPTEIALYPTTVPIVLNPQAECSPCWLLEQCPNKKYCTEGIRPEDVTRAIKEHPIQTKPVRHHIIA